MSSPATELSVVRSVFNEGEAVEPVQRGSAMLDEFTLWTGEDLEAGRL